MIFYYSVFLGAFLTMLYSRFSRFNRFSVGGIRVKILGRRKTRWGKNSC